jgi:hypothetical protein
MKAKLESSLKRPYAISHLLTMKEKGIRMCGG